jgi:hypothetical protein
MVTRRHPDSLRHSEPGEGLSTSSWIAAFKRRRRRQRLIGTALFWIGLALLAVDMTTTFPTPLRGQYATWWLLVAGAGAGLWMHSKRLPLEETIELARQWNGELKVTDVTSELNVTLETAERALAKLVRRGYSRRIDAGDTRVYIFPDVKAAVVSRPGDDVKK